MRFVSPIRYRLLTTGEVKRRGTGRRRVRNRIATFRPDHHVGGEKPADSRIGFQPLWTESRETSIASATAACERSCPRMSAAA